MHNGAQGAIQDFLKDLTNSNDAEIQEYITEIISNTEFQSHMNEYLNGDLSTKPFSLRVLAIDQVSCTALYSLCRKLKPDVVVETGVASGVSSSYILYALKKNNHGKLYSIDIPWHTVMTRWKRDFPIDDMSKVPPRETHSGWIIPDALKNRWELIVGKSSENLPPLLEKLGTIDIFHHDSEHTYENMLWEYQTVWPHLKAGGVLLTHNVDSSDAFSHFSQRTGSKMVRLANTSMGNNRPVSTAGMVRI